ncbi:hypothetical protein EJ02DRAFT_349055 [Clathrospora elynae]|uniref:Ima1 N-terminal domain-containing protein n=1 Tax=Clathrospora elynae TaxID=706981 RepID=A0A6A5SN47_9PLEO|nr:hypothetical protein EJ02DRAFT_349055 [Clathrospora elynae]
MVLLRRRLRCHYCNTQSRDSVPHIPKTYHCLRCDAVNHFDERGNITDPPMEIIATAPSTSFQQRIRSRSPSPVISVPGEERPVFCDTCQRNQTLFTKCLAEFLPDEEDPDYEKYLASYDEYKIELEDRYPQVCHNCLPRVQDQIRNANHVARADNLARIMEASKNRRTTVQTSRQAWTLRVISLAKWTYMLSTAVGILWHTAGIIMAPDEGIWAHQTFSLDVCLSQAFFVRSVDESCVMSPYIIRLLQYAIAADLCTIWWNPKLKVKTNSLTGRMRGLKSLWSIRTAVILLRFASLHYWRRALINYDTLKSLHQTHMVMLFVLALSSLLTWKTVRIVYGSAPSFRKEPSEPLLSTPNSAEKATRGTYRPAHPQPNAYDNMAQAFTSGLSEDGPALPPSPTLTESSYTTHATDATTPFKQRNASLGADVMDWTPTRKGLFASQAPEVLSNQFAKQNTNEQPEAPQQQKEQHSIFPQPDPNPFRHRVPAAPATSKVTPWKPSVWNPAPKAATPNFFLEDLKARGGVGEAKGLYGLGVPKNVKKDAELFASPKLKYDYYGTMRETGLEETFNGLFSK